MRPRAGESRRGNHETTSKSHFASRECQKSRATPQRELFDTHELRRCFAEVNTNSHGATVRALRHARSPQRVRRDQDTFARRHSESASTRTISAESSPRPRQIHKPPQRERFDTHHLRKGLAETKTPRNGESASTRTISAAGSPRSRQIRTAPQRERTISAEGKRVVS